MIKKINYDCKDFSSPDAVLIVDFLKKCRYNKRSNPMENQYEVPTAKKLTNEYLQQKEDFPGGIKDISIGKWAHNNDKKWVWMEDSKVRYEFKWGG